MLNEPSNEQMQTKCKNLVTASKNMHIVHAFNSIEIKYEGNLPSCDLITKMQKQTNL